MQAKTICTALAAFAGCTAARWYLDRSSRRESEFCGGRVRFKSLWNEGAAFGVPVPKDILPIAAGAGMGAACAFGEKAPIATGLLLGGGMSNQWERLRHGRVYDYVQFPKVPGPLKRYVFNLADFAIIAGGTALLLTQKRAK